MRGPFPGRALARFRTETLSRANDSESARARSARGGVAGSVNLGVLFWFSLRRRFSTASRSIYKAIANR